MPVAPGCDAVIRELMAAGVAQYVSVRLYPEIGHDRRALKIWRSDEP
jgi:hypothetical protein